LLAALNITSVPAAINTAEQWLEVARKDAEMLTAQRDEQERAELLRSMGLSAGDTVPPALRSEVKNLEEAQKRRATRSLRDGLDRILVDLLALYRDVLTIQLAAKTPLVNEDLRTQIQSVATRSNATETIAKLDAIAQTRIRIDANVRDAIALEALAVKLRTKP
jgi:DNA polymerase-3 subunit delta'